MEAFFSVKKEKALPQGGLFSNLSYKEERLKEGAKRVAKDRIKNSKKSSTGKEQSAFSPRPVNNTGKGVPMVK